MSEVTKIVMKAIQDDEKCQFESVLISVLTDVVIGFGNCGFFHRENWKEILESNFNANTYAKITLEYLAVANKNNDFFKALNKVAKNLTTHEFCSNPGCNNRIDHLADQIFVNSISSVTVPTNSECHNDALEVPVHLRDLEIGKSRLRKRNPIICYPNDSDSDDENLLTPIKRRTPSSFRKYGAEDLNLFTQIADDEDDSNDRDSSMDNYIRKNQNFFKKLICCRIHLVNFEDLSSHNGRLYICGHQNCDSILKSRRLLQQHLLIHTGEK